MGGENQFMAKPSMKDYGAMLARKSKDELESVGIGEKLKVVAVNGVFKSVVEADPNRWEEPISFDDYQSPLFPVEALPSWMGNFCRDVAKSMKTPIDLCGCMCLSALSLAVSKKYKVQAKSDHIEHLNIWTLTLLEPSNCKSPVAKLMIEPIRAYEKRQQELERIEIAQAREMHDTKKRRLESLKNMASKPQSDKGEKVDYFTEIKQLAVELEEEQIPTPTQMLMSDITTEQLITACYKQKGNLIGALTGEGRIIFDNWTKYGQGGLNINFYLSAYSNEYYTVDRRERHEIIEEPALVMGLAAQTDVLAGIDKKLFNKLNDSGLLARFLYSYPISLIGSRDFSIDYEIPTISKSQYFFNLAELLAVPLPEECYTFTLSNEAKGFYIGYRQQLEQDLKEGGNLENHHSWGGKAHGQLIRIAGLLHAAENVKHPRPWEVKISGETIQRAIILMNYFKEHMIAIFKMTDQGQSENKARKVLDYILSLKKETFTQRDIRRKFRKYANKEIEEVLASLESKGYMCQKVFEKKKIGRVSILYEINPIGTKGTKGQKTNGFNNGKGLESYEGMDKIGTIKDKSVTNEIEGSLNVNSSEFCPNLSAFCPENKEALTSVSTKGEGDLSVLSHLSLENKNDKREEFNILEGEI